MIRIYMIYLFLQFKRSFQLFPALILTLVIFSGIAAGIAFLGTSLLYPDQKEDGRIPIAIASSPEDSLTTLAISFLEMDAGIQKSCRFLKVTEESARDMLRDGKVAAAVLIPDKMVSSILDGTNIPVTIVLPKEFSYPQEVSQLFQSLLKAGLSSLDTAQAAIYAADELLIRYEKREHIPKAEQDLNQIFLSYALNRSDYFRSESLFAIGSLSVWEYYIGSGLLCAILLSGCAYYSYYHSETGILTLCMHRIGFPHIAVFLCRSFASACTVTLFFWVSFGIFGRMLSASSLVFMGSFFFSIHLFFQILFSLSKHPLSAILSLCLLSLGMLFLSGAFLPSAFLPKTVSSIGEVLPTGIWLRSLQEMLHSNTPSGLLSLWSMNVCFLGIQSLIPFIKDFFSGGNHL